MLAALCLAGCGKGDYDTHLVLRPRVRPVQSSLPAGEAGYLIRVYAWYIGEDEKRDVWAPSSYDEADAGIITNLKNNGKRGYDFVGHQPDTDPVKDEDTYIHLTLTRSPVFLVAVDPVNRFYAYRTLEIPKPMPYMQVTVMFQLWKPDTKFKDSDWTVVNGKKEAAEAEDEDTENTDGTE